MLYLFLITELKVFIYLWTFLFIYLGNSKQQNYLSCYSGTQSIPVNNFLLSVVVLLVFFQEEFLKWMRRYPKFHKHLPKLHAQKSSFPKNFPSVKSKQEISINLSQCIHLKQKWKELTEWLGECCYINMILHLPRIFLNKEKNLSRI